MEIKKREIKKISTAYLIVFSLLLISVGVIIAVVYNKGKAVPVVEPVVTTTLMIPMIFMRLTKKWKI